MTPDKLQFGGSKQDASATNNTLLRSENVRKRHRYKVGEIIVCASTILNNRIDQHTFTNVTTNAERNRNEARGPYVKLFREVIGNNVLLMDYNSRPDYLEGIQQMK